MEIIDSFGNRLRRLREKNEISQKALGQIVGVSGSTIGHYEGSRIFPSYDVLVRLADFFDTTCDYLLGRVDYSSKDPKLDTAFIRNNNMKISYGRMIEILAAVDEKDRENIYHVIASFPSISSTALIKIVDLVKEIL